MIISTKRGTPQEELQKIVAEFEAQGLEVTLIRVTDYNVFGLVGDTTKINEKVVAANPWGDSVTRVSAPYKKANRLFHEADSIIDVGGIKVGGSEKIAVIGGPCSIESEEQAVRIAREVKDAGGCMLRGGAYKPRTSPYAFQGLGTEGILAMAAARKATGMPIVSELMSEDSIHFPDSMKYNTLETKRIVYGGGGIMPDVFIPVDTSRYTDYHRSVVAAGLVNRIAMNYLDRHRAELNKKYPKFAQYKQNFNVTDDMMQELVTLAKDDKIEFNEEQYNRSKPLIMLQIKALIARDLYDMAQYFQIINDDNPSYQKALQIINNKETYNRLLGR